MRGYKAIGAGSSLLEACGISESSEGAYAQDVQCDRTMPQTIAVGFVLVLGHSAVLDQLRGQANNPKHNILFQWRRCIEQGPCRYAKLYNGWRRGQPKERTRSMPDGHKGRSDERRGCGNQRKKSWSERSGRATLFEGNANKLFLLVALFWVRYTHCSHSWPA